MLWLGLLVTVLIHAPISLAIILKADGRLVGPDGYMRLERVVELHSHGHWFNAKSLRTNAPIGETLHWTRPLDTLLLAGAWIGSAVTEFRTALEVWGMLVSPTMLLLLVVVWRYGTRDLLSNKQFLLSLIILPLLPMFDIGFAVGRPDHHSLLSLLFVSGLALMFRIVAQTASARTALYVGLLSGVAIWVSVAAITITTYFGAAFALLWLWRGQPFLRLTVCFVIGLFAATTGALLIEQPPSEWMLPVYNTISVVHVLLAACGAACWVVIAGFFQKYGKHGDIGFRLASVLAGAFIPALVVALVFPRFYLGPFADYDPAILHWFLNAVADHQPLVPISRDRAAVFLFQLGPALIGAVYALQRLRRGTQAERQLMALLLLGFACFMPLSLSAIRWIDYAQAVAWLPWTLVTSAIFSADLRVNIAGQLVQLRTPAVSAFLLSPFLISTAITSRPPSQATASVRCDWQQMAGYLSDRHAAAEGRETLLLTDLFRGPELVWSTPYNVVGTPYINAQSLGDTWRFFGAIDDSVPQEIVARRNVDLVLVCRGSLERQLYANAGPSTMFVRLAAGEPPQWLERVALPDELAGAFHLYRVAR